MTVKEIGPQTNRSVYGKTIFEMAEADDRIVVLDADISKSTTTTAFHKKYPHRALNVGVAEQNLVGMAAGLACVGLKPYASTFATFITMRACEQIRTAVAYPHLDVKLIGVNSGVEIAGDGATHQAIEDMAIMRSIPGMTVLCPSDPVSTRLATLALPGIDGPVYMRLGRQVSNVIHDENVSFLLGKMIRLREGNDVTIIACGSMVEQALIAAGMLEQDGIGARVLDCHTIKPIDVEEIVLAAEQTAGIITAEDHNIIGGLGGAVSEVTAEHAPAIVKRVGLQDIFARSGRDYKKLLEMYGICASHIYDAAVEIMRRKAKSIK